MKMFKKTKVRLRKMVTKNSDELNFLPNKWKNVAYSLILLVIAFIVFVNGTNIPLFRNNMESWGIFAFNILMLGFAVEIFTKDRKEDMDINKIRVTSLCFAFLMSILMSISSMPMSLIAGIKLQYYPLDGFLFLMVFLFYGNYGLRYLLLYILKEDDTTESEQNKNIDNEKLDQG